MTHPAYDGSLDVFAVGTHPVSFIMTNDVATLAPVMHLTQAMTVFAESGHVALPVVETDRRLVGILTEDDLMGALARIDPVLALLPDDQRRAAFALRSPGATVATAMTRNVTTISGAAHVSEAARLMARDGICCLPVVDGGRLTGIVTRDDLARVPDVAGAMPAPIRVDGRDHELKRLVQGEATCLRAGEWLVVRVRQGTATLQGRIVDEHRRLDLLRRIAAIAGIGRIEDRMEMVLDSVW